MITLITGALGTGKTALAVKLVTESEFYPASAFVFGVRGWKGAGHYEELPADPVRNQERVETVGRIGSSVFFVDEAKKIWPSRVAGRPVPSFLDAHLAESRSVGQDWIITAQAPGQLDVALRRLVGRHIHLEKVAFGVKKCEAGACRDDLKFFPVECEKYQFPISSLELYDSADLETSHQKKGLAIPKKFLWLGLLIITMFAVVGYFAYHSPMFQAGYGSKPQSVPAPPAVPGIIQSSSTVDGDNTLDSVAVLADGRGPDFYKPKDPVYPEFAKAPRLPVACISSSRSCSCYDQVGTIIQGFNEFRCRRIVAGLNELAVLYPKPEQPIGGGNVQHEIPQQSIDNKDSQKVKEVVAVQSVTVPKDF